ncbi:MAG TPA: glycosyltransferase [Caulobacterales bacterium]|nr:glycosyltransferase [Caulobacterales bacterium]
MSLSITDTAPAADQAGLELTILMPCLNEAETLDVCVRKARGYLARAGVKGEVLIADNGSTDGSQEIARKAGARVVDIPARGYGAALLGGIAAARGRYVIMGDADDSYDFETLGPFIERLRAGDELVMGNRFRGGIKPGAMPPLHRYLGNPVLSFLGRLFFHIPIGDFHCGLRGFSKASIDRLGLKSTGMEFASEMVVKASLNKLKISEVPTTLSKDGRTRAPHLKTWRDGWRHLRFLLLHSPRWLFFYPGVLLIAMGLLGVAALAPGALEVRPGIRLSTHTLAASCFAIIIGSQLMLFSFVARRYALIEGILPEPRNLGNLLSGLTLERLLQVSLLFVLIGIGGAGWALLYWASLNFGEISYNLVLRVLLISLTAIVVGVQMAASAFLASVFNLRR